MQYVLVGFAADCQRRRRYYALDLYTKKLAVSGSIDAISGKLSANVEIKTSEKCEIYITSIVYKYVDKVGS